MLAIGGTTRMGRRGPLWDLGDGVVVYPPVDGAGPWRAQWRGPDGARKACRAASEQLLADKLDPLLRERRNEPKLGGSIGADLIDWYLSPDRHPVDKPWSRSHLAGQRRLCRRFLLPVIGELPCEAITSSHLQQAINAANTADSGARVAKCAKALINVGIDAGYMENRHWPRLHWQACGRPIPAPKTRTVGRHVGYQDPRALPSHSRIADLAEHLVDDPQAPWWRELMVYLAACSGLRFGEQANLAAGAVRPGEREIDVIEKVVEIDGRQHLEAPKGRILRTAVYPEITPTGYRLADSLRRRVAEAERERSTSVNPHGLLSPAPRGGRLYHSNFTKRVLAPAYIAIGWRDDPTTENWTWHSLRHVFCTTALGMWGLSLEDVAILAGHTNSRTTQEVYVNAVEGTLDRARIATAPATNDTDRPVAAAHKASRPRPQAAAPIQPGSTTRPSSTKKARKLRRIASFA